MSRKRRPSVRVFVCLFVRYGNSWHGDAFCSIRHGGYADLGNWHATQADLIQHYPWSPIGGRPLPFELVPS